MARPRRAQRSEIDARSRMLHLVARVDDGDGFVDFVAAEIVLGDAPTAGIVAAAAVILTPVSARSRASASAPSLRPPSSASPSILQAVYLDRPCRRGGLHQQPAAW